MRARLCALVMAICTVVAPNIAAQQGAPGAAGPPGTGSFRVFDATDTVMGIYESGGATSQLGHVIMRSPEGVLFAIEIRKDGFTPIAFARDLYFEGPDCTGREFLETGPPGHRNDTTLRLIQASRGIEPDGYTTFPDPSGPPIVMVSQSFKNAAGCTNQPGPVSTYGRPALRVYLGGFVTPFRVEFRAGRPVNANDDSRR